MTAPARWMHPPKGVFRRRSQNSRTISLRCTSPSASAPSSIWTRSFCWKTARSWAWARTRSCCKAAPCIRISTNHNLAAVLRRDWTRRWRNEHSGGCERIANCGRKASHRGHARNGRHQCDSASIDGLYGWREGKARFHRGFCRPDVRHHRAGHDPLLYGSGDQCGQRSVRNGGGS